MSENILYIFLIYNFYTMYNNELKINNNYYRKLLSLPTLSFSVNALNNVQTV